MILQLMQKPSAYGCSLHQPSIKPKGMTLKGSSLIIITFLWMTQTSFSIVQKKSQVKDHLAQGIIQNIPQLQNSSHAYNFLWNSSVHKFVYFISHVFQKIKMEYSVIYLCSRAHAIITETMMTLVYKDNQLYNILNYRYVKIVFKKRPEDQQSKQSHNLMFILTVKLHEMHL